MKFASVIVALFISVISTNLLFNKYEIVLSELNAKAANILRGNHFALREFDNKGIPYSNIARLKRRVVSPFYVVHYGLIYSQNIPPPIEYHYLWEKQNSVKYWNVPPRRELVIKQNFYHAANWVVEKTSEYSGKGTHLLYNFDWPFSRLRTGGLRAPWYSGLTDGMALTLLCRAYVITQDVRYKEVATQLYKTLIKSIKDGGSLITLPSGDIWIEEYVENRLPDEYQSRVLNGMIYATFGIMDFERTFLIPNPIAPLLLKSIRNNIEKYDLGWWSSYDLIGTIANIKYHHIHLGLLDDLYTITQDSYYLTMRQKWGAYEPGFIVRNFIRGIPTPNSWMIFAEYILFAILLFCVLFVLFKRLRGKK